MDKITILKNATTPGKYIHNILGCLLQEVMPPDEKTHYTMPDGKRIVVNLLVKEQRWFLNECGIYETKGLTVMQANWLIYDIIIPRRRKGLAEPWQVEWLSSRTKRVKVENKGYYFGGLTKDEVNLMMAREGG